MSMKDDSGHAWHTCDDERCNVCLGGLAMCTMCGGAEGSLLPVCPGKVLSADEHDANYHAYCTSTGPFAQAAGRAKRAAKTIQIYPWTPNLSEEEQRSFSSGATALTRVVPS